MAPTSKRSKPAPWLRAEQTPSWRAIKSAERTLALFELFSVKQRPLGVGEISKALDVPQPSVSMLVKNLTLLSYLEHDRSSRKYVPTIRIMLLGAWINRRFGQEKDLARRVQALAAEFDETVVVAIQNGIYCQYVMVQLPSHPQMLDVQSGLLRPITRTAAGRMLLSLKGDAEVGALVRRCNAEMTDERLKVSPSEMRDIIDRIRLQGYARTAGEMTQGSSVIAVSIPAPVGKAPMAIGIGGRIERIAEKEAEILRALGYLKADLLES